jgi:hypothetical protein
MSNIDDDKINKLIHRIGLEFQLQDDVIRKIVNSPYKFTRETIHDLPLVGIETEEDFNKIKTNFIYVHIGKLYTSYAIYKKIHKQSANLTEKWKKRDQI